MQKSKHINESNCSDDYKLNIYETYSETFFYIAHEIN